MALKIVMSSGHAKYVRGASSILDEVDQARRVVESVAEKMRGMGVDVITYHDDVSTTQSENLERIVSFHNSQGQRDLDVSVHFNAYTETSSPMGTECLYVTQDELADKVSSTIAAAGGFIDRGPKKRDDLYFLNNTDAPAILIEVCFVDSEADAKAYDASFESICWAIAGLTSGKQAPQIPDPRVRFEGTCSWFGGPADEGVDEDEGLAFFYEVDDAPHLFLPEQPTGTTGLARRLDPKRPYVACRWDYDVTPKEMLRDPHQLAVVRNKKTLKEAFAWPADWGPHEEKTGRAADLSPRIMEKLDLETDDEVEVIYPVRFKQK